MENTRIRKVTPVLSRMMNVEIRFFALLILSVITVYIVYENQRESTLSNDLAQLNRIVKKVILEQKHQHPKLSSMDNGMIIEGSSKKMINTNSNKVNGCLLDLWVSSAVKMCVRVGGISGTRC